jgi:hypothetical protein
MFEFNQHPTKGNLPSLEALVASEVAYFSYGSMPKISITECSTTAGACSRTRNMNRKK